MALILPKMTKDSEKGFDCIPEYLKNLKRLECIIKKASLCGKSGEVIIAITIADARYHFPVNKRGANNWKKWVLYHTEINKKEATAFRAIGENLLTEGCDLFIRLREILFSV